ncbi:MAG: endopeptidase La [Oscillospiraceae bacterium]|jgi:ATP-dependent Lon protease|nr:endopeptidase La [Oscillospiraceae bacterium]
MAVGEFYFLPIYNYIIYPGTELYLDCDVNDEIKALEAAMLAGRRVFLLAQKAEDDSDDLADSQDVANFYSVGVLATVKQILKKSSGTAQVLVRGEIRAQVVELRARNGESVAVVEEYSSNSTVTADAKKLPTIEKSLIRVVKKRLIEYARFFPKISKDAIVKAIRMKSGGDLVDYIAMNLMLGISIKQQLLELTAPYDRLFALAGALEKEIEIINYQIELGNKLRTSIEDGQRVYHIREQIKILRTELANYNEFDDEVREYINKIKRFVSPLESQEHLIKEARKLTNGLGSSYETAVTKSYLDVCLDLPWKSRTKDRINVKTAAKILDKNHFGLDKIKEKILEMVAIKALNVNAKWQILCLVGPPGVGKTSIARAIAEAVNRKYVQISLGGLKDESEIRGHRKTYVGSMPGRIISGLRTAGCKNPLILLDEIDKVASDHRSNPTAALLEVLDYEQNRNFKDNYLEIPFDLSEVLFVTTANYMEDIPTPLLNRMEVIELGSYTKEEKFNIIKKHVIPKQLKEYLLSPGQIKFKDAVIYKIVDDYTREAGVRAAARLVGSLCRKAIKNILESQEKTFEFTIRNLEKYAGKAKYSHRDVLEKNEVGVVTGLAWTQMGGETMCIEAISTPGSGKLELTGSLGKVMQESAKTALSYIRKASGKLKIDQEAYKANDIHLHVPAGAVPKDGPSAGTAMSTAMVSALTQMSIRKNVAVTGEISLRGKVMPVGGVKEKVVAAYQVGIETIVLPKENEADLEEIDQGVKNRVKFIFAKTVEEVWEATLIDYHSKSSINPTKEFSGAGCGPPVSVS